VADVFAEGIEATVPTTVRETVDAVAALKKNEVSLGELAAKLALDKSVTSRRLRDATDRGYLVNLEIRRGRPGADRPWRSDAGNGEAAARAGRIGYVIAVLHRCSVAEGMTWLIPPQFRVLHCCSISEGVTSLILFPKGLTSGSGAAKETAARNREHQR
jgi:hypothetical protein